MNRGNVPFRKLRVCLKQQRKQDTSFEFDEFALKDRNSKKNAVGSLRYLIARFLKSTNQRVVL